MSWNNPGSSQNQSQTQIRANTLPNSQANSQANSGQPGAAAAGLGHQNIQPPPPAQPAQGLAPVPRSKGPLKALSYDLIKTYKRINDVYYAKRERKKKAQAEAFRFKQQTQYERRHPRRTNKADGGYLLGGDPSTFHFLLFLSVFPLLGRPFPKKSPHLPPILKPGLRISTRRSRAPTRLLATGPALQSATSPTKSTSIWPLKTAWPV